MSYFQLLLSSAGYSWRLSYKLFHASVIILYVHKGGSKMEKFSKSFICRDFPTKQKKTKRMRLF